MHQGQRLLIGIVSVLLLLGVGTSWGGPPPTPPDSDENFSTAGGTEALLNTVGSTITAPFPASQPTWQPSGWVYASDDYAYASQDAVWRFILRDPSAGPWSYSFTTGAWVNRLIGGWNYVLPAGSGTYYAYNLSASGWDFLSLTPGQLWYFDLATAQWGTVAGPPGPEPPGPCSCPACSGQAVCRQCVVGIACGNSCINRSLQCHQPPGCACNLAQ